MNKRTRLNTVKRNRILRQVLRLSMATSWELLSIGVAEMNIVDGLDLGNLRIFISWVGHVCNWVQILITL
jgi:hypothetical protein